MVVHGGTHSGAWWYMVVHVGGVGGGVGYDSGPVLEQTGVGFTLGLVLVLLGMHVGGFPWIVFGTSIGQERTREEKERLGNRFGNLVLTRTSVVLFLCLAATLARRGNGCGGRG